MTLTAFRLCLRRHGRAGAFLGEGARRAGGRWNPPGIPVVYTSATLSLASLEFLAHFDRVQDAPELLAVRVEFDDSLVSQPEKLPEDWQQLGLPVSTQRIGEAWVKSRQSAVLRVPSVIIPTENNYVLNPAHPDFGKLVIQPAQPFSIDPRLVR